MSIELFLKNKNPQTTERVKNIICGHVSNLIDIPTTKNTLLYKYRVVSFNKLSRPQNVSISVRDAIESIKNLSYSFKDNYVVCNNTLLLSQLRVAAINTILACIHDDIDGVLKYLKHINELKQNNNFSNQLVKLLKQRGE